MGAKLPLPVVSSKKRVRLASHFPSYMGVESESRSTGRPEGRSRGAPCHPITIGCSRHCCALSFPAFSVWSSRTWPNGWMRRWPASSTRSFSPRSPPGSAKPTFLPSVPGRTDGALLVHVEIEARASSEMPYRLRGYAARIQAAYGEQVLSILVNIRRRTGGSATRHAGERAVRARALAVPLRRFRSGRLRPERCSWPIRARRLGSCRPDEPWHGEPAAYKLACQKPHRRSPADRRAAYPAPGFRGGVSGIDTRRGRGV